MAMKQELQWREPYVSQSLNSKLSGALPPGIYQGFVVTPGGGMTLDVSVSPDYPRSVAVVDRGGYNFTVTTGATEHFTVPDGTNGTYFLCIDSEYTVGGGGSSQFVILSLTGIQKYHVVLARLIIPYGTTIITSSMIDCAQKVTRSIYTVNPNHFINGSFDVWQLGASQTTSGMYSDDKWYNEHSGSTKTHSRQAFSDDFHFKDGSKAPKFFSRTVVTSSNGAANFVRKCYRVSNVRNFSGQHVTISLQGRADAGKNIAIEAVQRFGVGGSASVEGIGAQKILLGTEFDKKIARIFIPSVVGKTIGTGGDDYLEFRIWFDAGSVYSAVTDAIGQQFGTFDLAAMKLETGKDSTKNIPRLHEEELALCNDYQQGIVPAGAVMHFAMVTPPPGWILANGSLVSRITYPYLFRAIGTVFGAGDGLTTFKLPDLRGEFIRGFDSERGVDSGRSFGSFQGDDFKSHNHQMSFSYDRSPVNPGNAVYGDENYYGEVIRTTTLTGGNETRPRNIALLPCIKY